MPPLKCEPGGHRLDNAGSGAGAADRAGSRAHQRIADQLGDLIVGRRAAYAGALLEHIADRLSWTRGMSIVRGRGDGSLGDRWPSVANALRKTDADEIGEQVTRSPVFRKLVAPQDDGQPRSVSTVEATRFGK